MYICVCFGVTDTQIKQAIENGATDLKALQAELNVGSQCGKCIRTTLEMMEQTKDLEPNYYQAA
ncbi:bacterioferritin-associated ferredoxin [Ferrimonas lipolytica]|uniref:Bacterioferritin-associated ferredoxin n=1 Tax=Ferrimonas lipolytica TaxID=2724191 RepID=A0A6H1UJ51_9GAMM|nr:bacterioferritin-associated ferredoxin [Ferrimonas lipolytica]QIZ78640.1 (2Fe-2S)-binding protein [Ferrimonas lipolytica]